MANETGRNLKLGAFVLAGTVFLIIVLYMIGAKRNLFSNTFTITADFYNVNGLMAGNNVRFSGINVGTVESVEIISDSSVRVVMLIQDKVKQYIKKNSVATVGTDGLMGNKLVNINAAKDGSMAPSIEEGDELKTLRPIETDEMIRTLSTTNDNIKNITADLKTIAQKINSRNTLWSLLMDTVVAENIKQAVVNIKMAGNNAAVVIGDLHYLTKEMKGGKGLIGTLITDTTLSTRLDHTMVKLNLAGDNLAVITGDLGNVSKKINTNEGTLGMLIMDTMFVKDLKSAMKNLDSGTGNFNENMEALKHNILLRKYFKKKAKEAEKKK